MTQKQIILEMLKFGELPKHALVNRETPYGLLTISADRRLRDLAEEGRIEVVDRGKKENYYRIKVIPTQLGLL